MKAKVYSQEFKLTVIKAFLIQQHHGAKLCLRQFALTHYPEVGTKLIYNWLHKFKERAGKELNMSANEIENSYGSQANTLSLKQKQKILKETAHLNELELGAYCREKGIYASDIAIWEQEIDDALNRIDSAPSAYDVKGSKNQIKELKQQLSALEKQVKKQDRLIDKKDKALATYAAKIITLKNFQNLFANETKED